ncbi:LpxI family protein [Rickettsia endosymbiont of Nabis limbatus]|uniref:LpxI family protein n=1 Tax=Rickettsia endosymbiont of Nabis limbatus TaxID=3066268 RepID=UPI003AF3D120
MLPNLGIIAGKGSLPSLIAGNYRKQGGNCYIAAIEGEADIELIKDFEYQPLKIGMVGAAIKYFTQHNVKNIIFIGGVDRPNFKNLAVDSIGGLLLLKMISQKIRGDDNLLRIVASFFESYGFKVISSSEIYQNQQCDSNIITDTIPTSSDKKDIEFGVKLLNHLSKFDIGQSVIVEDGYVLGIEAAEGTDNLIARCTDLRKKSHGGVLIKLSKIGQDNRLDLPTIGINTIKNLAKYNYKGVAIQKNQVIIAEEEKTIKLANEHKIFITKC